MKALVKKYPINATNPELNEVYPDSQWHDWINRETGAPLTDENYAYALCVECPDDFMDLSRDMEPTEMFEVKGYTKIVVNPSNPDEMNSVTYWLATWKGTSQDPEREAEIAELKARLAALENDL